MGIWLANIVILSDNKARLSKFMTVR